MKPPAFTCYRIVICGYYRNLGGVHTSNQGRLKAQMVLHSDLPAHASCEVIGYIASHQLMHAGWGLVVKDTKGQVRIVWFSLVQGPVCAVLKLLLAALWFAASRESTASVDFFRQRCFKVLGAQHYSFLLGDKTPYVTPSPR